ncbi:MAG: proline--tRNA ligase [Bacillota bacterium]|jgi:prolyl-tRNA synthetase
MKASQLYAPTLREVPAEAEIISHKLMLRAGMLHRTAAGIYSYLPLAWKVMKKIMNIIREEMDGVGGQEICMPILQPSEIWQASERWDVYGDELFRLKDRHQRDFCLGPTHEEIITTLVKNNIRSYKQLPQRLYQIQTKFRDERRPRFGLMRGREFMMQDMYSFDRDEESLETSYRLSYEAYSRIFSRCGLDFRPVEADSGAIGGSGSHEFMALADSGESEIIYCSDCEYAASNEVAAVKPLPVAYEEAAELQEVATPDCKAVEDVATLLAVPREKIVKTMCYRADDQLVLVLCRGDRQINEVKLKNTLNCLELVFADDNALAEVGLIPGFLGPQAAQGLKVIADDEVVLLHNHVCGANKEDYHLINVNPGRDYQVDITADIRLVTAGEACPHCGQQLLSARGIEVGQVFKLYDKYSQALGAHFINEAGKEQAMMMGCYGIGVGRTMAAIIEQSYDENGIIWPFMVAPYHVVLVPVNDKDEELIAIAETLYKDLLSSGIEVMIDDRRERPGVKFNDADLIGFPLRVTIGKKAKQDGLVELKIRKSGKVMEVPIEQTAEQVCAIIKKELNK